MVKEKEKTREKKKEQQALTKELVLHNDDHNTFDHVINALVEICDHDPLQAEQCSLITHYKGKCAIKSGPIAFLKPIYKSLLSEGLTVTIS